MQIVTQLEAILLLMIFAAAMFFFVFKFRIAQKSTSAFLLANRNVSLLQGSFSIAVSWVWAPAIFICSLQAYTKGLPGIFWFTFPNVLCFFVFAPFAKKLRNEMPEGFTFPQLIAEKFNDKRTHLAFCVVFFGYQLGAIIINALAGGILLNTITGINTEIAIISLSALALSYSLIGGMKASVTTDTIQMSMVLIITLVLVPLCIFKTGSSNITQGLSGVDGLHGALLNPWIAFTMGIPMTISLLSGPLADQMFFQRAFSVKKEHVTKTFIYGGLLFAVIPIGLSMLGFIGASLAKQGLIEVNDPQMIAPIVIAYLLPKPALYLFCLMAFAGLCSTIDSAFCASSSLGAVDIYKKYINSKADDASILKASKTSMVIIAILGTSIALLQPKLLWVFLIYGALAAASFFPTLLALLWKRSTSTGIFWGITISLMIGTPLAIYANTQEQPYLVVASSILSISIGLIVCLIQKEKYHLKSDLPIFTC